MTREEAISVLHKIKPTPRRADGKSLTHIVETIALDLAIEALEQETVSRESYDHEFFLRKELEVKIAKLERTIEALEQEPCEDAISRKSMLDYQQYLHGKMSNEENFKLWEFIKDLPSVTPAPKKCHNVNTDYAECDQFVCSNCGIELQDWHRVERDEDGDITHHEYEFNYCPNCGAKIKGCDCYDD